MMVGAAAIWASVFDHRNGGKDAFEVQNCLNCGSFRVVVLRLDVRTTYRRLLSKTAWQPMRSER